MAWRALTEDDLKTKLSGVELSIYRSVVLAAGQADPIQPLLTMITDKVRGYIGNCQRNTLGPEGTLPDKLISSAIDMAVIEVMGRAAGKVTDPHEVRKEAMRTAIQLMRDVARCEFAVEKPDVNTDENLSFFQPSISGRCHHNFGQRAEEGI